MRNRNRNNRGNNADLVAEALPAENIDNGYLSEIKASMAEYQQNQLKPATRYISGALVLGAAGIFLYYNLSVLAALVPAVGAAACFYKTVQHIGNVEGLEKWWKDRPELAPSQDAQNLYSNLTKEQKRELLNVASEVILNQNSQKMDIKGYLEKGCKELQRGGSLRNAILKGSSEMLLAPKNCHAAAETINQRIHLGDRFVGEQNVVADGEGDVYPAAEVTLVPRNTGVAGQLQQPQQRR